MNMWKRKEIKKEGRKHLARNYIACVCVCFLLAFLGSEYASSATVIHSYDNSQSIPNNVITHTKSLTNTNIFNGEADILTDITKAVPHGISYLFKLASSIKNFIATNFSSATLILLAFIIELLYLIFIALPIIVGSRKFFLTNHHTPKAKIRNIFAPYKNKNILNIAKNMFLQNIYLILWFFTVIGFFIKIYEYRMIPYILAENPDITTKDLFRQTKNIMNGNKWEMFKFDLSYLGWDLLNLLTLGLSGIFYSNPYKLASQTEIYLKIKNVSQ